MKVILSLLSSICLLVSSHSFADTASADAHEARPNMGGDLRAPSPKMFDKDRQGFFQIGVGPAYGIGFHSDSSMYNILASYNWNMSDRITAKALADMYFATGSVTSRMLNYGLGADVYIPEMNPFSAGIPYASAEVALGNGRDSVGNTGTGVTVGAGAGFKFMAAQLNWDISLNYALLATQVGDSTPSVVGMRAAVNF